MFNKKLLGASIFALATSFISIQSQAAPIVTSSLLAQVDNTFDGDFQSNSSTTPSGPSSRANVSNDRNNGIDYANGHAVSYTNGRTYVTSDINNYYYNGCEGEICDGPQLALFDIAPPQNDPIDHVSRDVISLASWSMQIQGDATNDMQYDLDFYIPNSSINIYSDFASTIEASSEVHAQIKLDNVVIWSFGYKLSSDAGTTSYELTSSMGIVPDVECDLYPDGPRCDTSFFSSILDLGIISAGSSALLEYEAWAETKIAAYTAVDDCNDFNVEFSGCYLDIRAQFGDPSSISARLPVLTPTPVTTTSVPEPGIIGLFGLGLAGLFIRRRRK